ncbi:MAG: tRNA (adenosine(37)-N6)-dimethylallyltransferase MiaA [Syntrophotalea acetylenica]|jgi:tRNA dimethylallyltransferase|uniref:tRNA (adenosine(37)-N6)-dimethylallyltransferase MiaA n=1 Tax=Syntrophotalea sp. TaxID=2812029 RepID=UPI003D11EC30|nr:tRNA (adenosine(37)-N6)-dimethylallyltransferase MiaA [Syntrophotalea acetylenica]
MKTDTQDTRPPVVVVCGPTAAGKTALGVRLADHLPVEIISADSRQVYRRMDVGTAKPSAAERSAVCHHLIDVVDPDESFTAADFVCQGRRALNDILQRGRLPLVVGGTGLYIQALLHGLVDVPGGNSALRESYLQLEEQGGKGTLHARLQNIDPVLAQRLDPHDLVRIVRGLEVHALCGRRLSEVQAEQDGQVSPFRVLTLAVTLPREDLYARIDQRVIQMLDAGLEQEVALLLASGLPEDSRAMQTIGYREMVQYLKGVLPLDEALRLMQRDTRRYAKRQLTWFRKVKSIIWLDSSAEFAKVLKLIDSFFYAA